MTLDCSLQPQALTVSQLCLSIGNKIIADKISFSIPSKTKVALVGLNGAGKSSLIKLLIGELKADEGDIRFQPELVEGGGNGKFTPDSRSFKAKLGYQASNMLALGAVTAYEYLRLCCQLKGMLKSSVENQIAKVVEQWQLSEIISRPLTQLSQGNLQKLMIAQAFINQAEFIFLDEPTQALDPVEQQRFVDNLCELDDFQICLFSSHHISEAVATANLVLILHCGQLVALLNLDSENEYWLMTNLSQEKLESVISSFKHQMVSIELCYQNKNNLFCIRNLSAEIWKKLLQELAPIDQSLNGLGRASHAMMPLFAILANEQL